MAAVTQIRYRRTKGRTYYDKKLAEGKPPERSLRALERQSASPSSPACRDARRAAAAKSPGGQGEPLYPRAGSRPQCHGL